jgi:hypothetical protein
MQSEFSLHETRKTVVWITLFVNVAYLLFTIIQYGDFEVINLFTTIVLGLQFIMDLLEEKVKQQLPYTLTARKLWEEKNG